MIAPMLNLSIRNTPTGDKLTCKGWVQEAALRMLLNNLDPEVAERPEELIVGSVSKCMMPLFRDKKA